MAERRGEHRHWAVARSHWAMERIDGDNHGSEHCTDAADGCSQVASPAERGKSHILDPVQGGCILELVPNSGMMMSV
jgi:hypothetical protein